MDYQKKISKGKLNKFTDASRNELIEITSFDR